MVTSYRIGTDIAIVLAVLHAMSVNFHLPLTSSSTTSPLPRRRPSRRRHLLSRFDTSPCDGSCQMDGFRASLDALCRPARPIRGRRQGRRYYPLLQGRSETVWFGEREFTEHFVAFRIINVSCAVCIVREHLVRGLRQLRMLAE